MKKLANKVAIITGAAQGMGAGHAREFIAQGAKVVLTDINTEKGQALAQELGESALFIQHNVASEQDWQKVVEGTLKQFGKIDILVNNAGITFAKPILQTSLEDYRRIVDINQISVFLGIKAVLPAMQENGSGSIVNISSINGIVGGAVGYTDTKFAVRGLTKAAAVECAQHNIRVNSVHPGVIETPMIMQPDTKAAVEAFAQTIPLKRIAKPQEVTQMVLFLASDDSSYCTGTEFIIDGGLTAV